MDRPVLSPSLRQALVTVLGKRGVAPGEIERILASLGAAATPEVAAILEARHPERAAWVAPMDGYLSLHTAGYLLSKEARLVGDYSPSEGRVSGGGAMCWSRDGQYRTGFRYRALDGRALVKDVGGAVTAGEALTDGAIDPHDVVEILGEAVAFARFRELIASLCSLDPALAEVVVAPLFGFVEIVESRGSRLRPGTRLTKKRFDIEVGRVLGRALARLPDSADPRLLALARLPEGERAEGYSAEGMHGVVQKSGRSFDPPSARPVLVGYPEVATLDDEGRLPGPEIRFDLGTFEITSGVLRVTDPAYFRAGVGKNDLPAVLGTWRAESIVEVVGSSGQRVTELWAWVERLAPNRDDAMADVGFFIGVDSGLAGFFDVSQSADKEASRLDFSEVCGALALAAGPPQAAIVKGFGVVSFSGLGDGGYRCKMLQNEDGAVIAVGLDFHS
jgi:hypothetical protein